jgi:hypothetical protein
LHACDDRLFDGDDTVIHTTEKAAATADLPVGGHLDSIDESEKARNALRMCEK